MPSYHDDTGLYAKSPYPPLNDEKEINSNDDKTACESVRSNDNESCFKMSAAAPSFQPAAFEFSNNDME